MAACFRILVLTFNQILVRSIKIRFSNLDISADYFVKHMNSNEVGHFRIHNLILKKLKSEIYLFTTPIRFSLNLHIVEVYFAFTNTSSKLLLLLNVMRYLLIKILFTHKKRGLVAQKICVVTFTCQIVLFCISLCSF